MSRPATRSRRAGGGTDRPVLPGGQGIGERPGRPNTERGTRKGRARQPQASGAGAGPARGRVPSAGPAIHQRGDADGIGRGVCRRRNAERGRGRGRQLQDSGEGAGGARGRGPLASPAVHELGDAGGIGRGVCRSGNAERGTRNPQPNAERGARKGRLPQSSADGPAALESGTLRGASHPVSAAGSWAGAAATPAARQGGRHGFPPGTRVHCTGPAGSPNAGNNGETTRWIAGLDRRVAPCRDIGTATPEAAARRGGGAQAQDAHGWSSRC
jgi:hypothetical protein